MGSVDNRPHPPNRVITCPSEGWALLLLGEVVTLRRGFDLPAAMRRPGSVPVISSSGVTGYHDVAKIDAPGVVTGRYGTLGEVFFIEEPSWPLNTTLYVEDFKGNDPKYVSYLLKTMGLQNRSGAAAVPGLNRNDLHRLAVLLPRPNSQRRIVSILSAYDDLIENNTRRIQILEDMARAIYREWFVELRFPGHEDVRMVDSELGPIPEGWRVAAIGETVRTLGGGTPSKDVPGYWADGSFTWYTPTDLTKSGSMFIERSGTQISSLGLSRSSAIAFPARSVMMTSRATIGVVSITTVEAATNQGFITCVPNEDLGEYHLYFWLLSNVDLFSSLASGATFKEISRSKFRPIQIAVAPRHIEHRFHEAISPIGDLILNLQRSSVNLRTIRDLLLPRLISGEIDVSNLDTGDAEPAA